MAVTRRIQPQGWVFHTADFSSVANGMEPKGNVILVREKEQYDLWHKLPNDMMERIPVFVTGYGTNLQEAMDHAFKIASTLGRIPMDMAQAAMDSLQQSAQEITDKQSEA